MDFSELTSNNMDSDDSMDQITNWTQADTIKTFDWVAKEPSPLSKILHQSPACSMDNSNHYESSTKLVDNTPSIRDNFIEQLTTKASAPVSLLVESLVQQLVTMIEPDRTKAEHLYKMICQQLHRIHLIDETYKMGEFDVMRSQYQRALYQLATIARGQSEVPLKLQSVWPLSDSSSMHWSRYHCEFEELNFVAKGGFGSVYRARNKLDGIEYAIKKCQIKYRTMNRVLSHLAEVKTFASLNHNNIVPYKAAWLEPLFGDPVRNRPRVTDAQHMRRKNVTTDKRRYNTKKTSKTSISKGFRVAICEADLKFSANTNTTTTTATMTTTENADDDESESETESSDSDADVHHNNLQVPTDNRGGQDESSDFIQFQRTNNDDDNDDEDGGDDDAVDGANFSSIKNLTPDKRLCKPNKNRANNNFIPGSLEFNETQPHLRLKWATLYIQMSFRPLTLRTWLDERNKHADFTTFFHKFIKQSIQQWDRTVIDQDDIDGSNDVLNLNGGHGTDAAAILKYSDRNRRNITAAATAAATAATAAAASPLSPTLEKNLSKKWDSLDVTLDIFVQVLSGLRYIHLQNIVHHDIKPSNIFIGCEKNGELYVQLGDFGLACPLETKHSPDSVIGTVTYAAPEQLKGQCNKKSDVYSLGIILLELLIPFNTDMERLKTIEAARKGIFPQNLPPKFLDLVKLLFQKPIKRPDAIQTFDYLAKFGLWNGNSDSTHEDSTGHRKNYLQNQLTQVTDELNQLKLQLSSSPKDTTTVAGLSHMSSFECSRISTSSTTVIGSSPNGSFDLIDTDDGEQSASSISVKTQIGCLSENDEKDRQISFLTNKLNESDKEAKELRREVERLRDIIKQRNG